MGELFDARFTPSDEQIIRRKARRFSRRCDPEDMEQELALHLIEQSHRFDPARGTREKFVERVTGNRALNILESSRAGKRCDKRNVSLGVVGEKALSDDSDPEWRDKMMDLQDALSRMPEDLRQIAIMRISQTVPEIGRELCLTLMQVRTRLMKIRKFFEENEISL